MIMTASIKPYAYTNIKCIQYVFNRYNRYYFLDNYGRWEITQETYNELLERGIPKYERKESSHY